jgi:hypothetical protein
MGRFDDRSQYCKNQKGTISMHEVGGGAGPGRPGVLGAPAERALPFPREKGRREPLLHPIPRPPRRRPHRILVLPPCAPPRLRHPPPRV